MTARIVGFVTREQAGLVRPRSVSRNITPQHGGVGVHHGGGPQSAAEPDSDHSLCIAIWRGWQRFHMRRDTLNAADIAYTGGYCNHGYAFAGRGAGVRTAANGTNIANQNFYAVVWIGGAGQTPTELALDALDWWISQLRHTGHAGRDVKPHSSFKATACPIQALRQHAASRDGQLNLGLPTTGAKTGTVRPTTAGDSPQHRVHHVQRALGVSVDGKWGPQTDGRALTMRNASRAKRGWPRSINQSFNIREAQAVINTNVDGIWGPLSQAALITWIKNFQRTLNVKDDGYWGPKTDGKFLAVRRNYLNNF